MSIDISDTLLLLYFVRNMLEHRYDIRMWESCVDPNPLMVERQDPDNCSRFQTRERCALEIAAYVFKDICGRTFPASGNVYSCLRPVFRSLANSAQHSFPTFLCHIGVPTFS